MNRTRGPRPAIPLCALLVVATLASFWPVLHNGFIKLDDGFYLVHNPRVAGGLSWESIRWAFQTGYQGNWHPVTWLSHMLDVELFGLTPAWHHLVSLLLHTGNALLLMLLLKRLTLAPWRSFFVAAFFALHPLRVESVAWAAERKDVLCTFFFLLMLLMYAAYVKSKGGGTPVVEPEPSDRDEPTSPSPREPVPAAQAAETPRYRFAARTYYRLTLVFFALALMSKAMVVTAPFVLLLLDFWPLGRLGAVQGQGFPNSGAQGSNPSPAWNSALKGLVREKLPFFGLAMISSAVTFVVQASHRAMYLDSPLDLRLANAVASYWRYLGLAVWPRDLSIFYPFPQDGSQGLALWPGTILGVAAVALILVSVLAAWGARRAPWLATGWFWYVGTLVPVIGIVQVGGQAMADRYTYIPLIGIAIAVVWGVGEWTCGRRTVQIAAATGGALCLAACAARTHAQAEYWRNDFTVFSHALKIDPRNALAHYHVGIALRDQGQTAQAMEQFRATIKDDPAFAPAYSEIGAILEDQGKEQEARELYEQAFNASPWTAQIHNHLGARLWAAGNQEAALAQYAAALRSDPDFPDAHFNLGLALFDRGQLPEAAAEFTAVCRLRPGDAEALGCLADTLIRERRLAPAADCLRDLVRVAPTNAEAHQKLGLILVEQGELGQATAQFRQAVKLNPNWPEPLNALALVLATHPQTSLRNGPEAVSLAERACRLSGDKQPRYWGTLDIAYAEVGRFSDAIAAATKARDLAAAAGQTNAAQAAEARIQLYRQQRPFHP